MGMKRHQTEKKKTGLKLRRGKRLWEKLGYMWEVTARCMDHKKGRFLGGKKRANAGK